MDNADRRRHPRYDVNTAYTPALVRTQQEDEFTRQAHVYDISEGGIRLELDIAIEPGTPIAVQVMLPGTPISPEDIDGPGRAVFALGNVVWCDDSEPGPVSVAIAITRFARDSDLDRLRRRLAWSSWATKAA
ncbi:MAG: PilZ domain-containing protein [Planctomycetota bacterium]